MAHFYMRLRSFLNEVFIKRELHERVSLAYIFISLENLSKLFQNH